MAAFALRATSDPGNAGQALQSVRAFIVVQRTSSTSRRRLIRVPLIIHADVTPALRSWGESGRRRTHERIVWGVSADGAIMLSAPMDGARELVARKGVSYENQL